VDALSHLADGGLVALNHGGRKRQVFKLSRGVLFLKHSVPQLYVTATQCISSSGCILFWGKEKGFAPDAMDTSHAKTERRTKWKKVSSLIKMG
jgi:hypothetical protein